MKRTSKLVVGLLVALALFVAALPLLSSCRAPAPTPTATPRPTPTPTMSAAAPTPTPVSTPTPTKVPPSPTPTSPPAATPTLAPTKPATYKIGLDYMLTGAMGWFGEVMRNAALLAADEINAAGGIGGVPITLIAEDNAAISRQAIEAATKLIDVDKVAVIVSNGGGIIPALLPITEERHVVLYADTVWLYEKQYTKTNKYFVATFPTYEGEARGMADGAVKAGYKTAVVAYVNNAVGQGESKSIESYGPTVGLKVLAMESHELDQKDFKTQLLKFKSLDPDVFFVLVYNFSQGVLLVQQAREMGFKPRLVIGSTNVFTDNFIKGAGDAAEGVVSDGIGWNPNDLSNTKGVEFARKWNAKYPTLPLTYLPAYAYDAIYNIAWAIQQGGYSGEGIAKALRSMKDRQGICGNYTIDPETGRNIGASVYFVRVHNGKFEPWEPGK